LAERIRRVPPALATAHDPGRHGIDGPAFDMVIPIATRILAHRNRDAFLVHIYTDMLFAIH
jgi:hypothetical protein